MRPQAVRIRRPLRSNGQRVVNNTQKLSSKFLFEKSNTQLLAQQVTREAALRAPTAPPPTESRRSWGPWAPQEALRSPRERPKTPTCPRTHTWARTEENLYFRPKTAPRSPQEAPRAAQDAPRAAQERTRATQERPRAGQDDPRAAQEAPRPPQDRPKRPQDPPQRLQHRPRRPQDRPRWRQDRPKRPQDHPRPPQEVASKWLVVTTCVTATYAFLRPRHIMSATPL